MKKTIKSTKIILRIEPELVQKLKDYSKENKTAYAKLIREFIKQLVDKK